MVITMSTEFANAVAAAMIATFVIIMEVVIHTIDMMVVVLKIDVEITSKIMTIINDQESRTNLIAILQVLICISRHRMIGLCLDI